MNKLKLTASGPVGFGKSVLLIYLEHCLKRVGIPCSWQNPDEEQLEKQMCPTEEQAWNQLVELKPEVVLVEHGPKGDWKEAIIEQCCVTHIGWDEHDPRKTLAQLIDWHVKVAIDPKVSTDARKLFNSGIDSAIHCVESDSDLKEIGWSDIVTDQLQALKL